MLVCARETFLWYFMHAMILEKPSQDAGVESGGVWFSFCQISSGSIELGSFHVYLLTSY